MNSKYQMTCPKCKYEFQYNKECYDKEISKLSVEIADITTQLHQHNLRPYQEQRINTDWWLRAKKSLSEKQKELAELKAFRKVANEEINRNKAGAFMKIVRSKYGDKEYFKLLDEAEKELEAYNYKKEIHKKEYTRSNSLKNVTSINKL